MMITDGIAQVTCYSNFPLPKPYKHASDPKLSDTHCLWSNKIYHFVYNEVRRQRAPRVSRLSFESFSLLMACGQNRNGQGWYVLNLMHRCVVALLRH